MSYPSRCGHNFEDLSSGNVQNDDSMQFGGFIHYWLFFGLLKETLWFPSKPGNLYSKGEEDWDIRITFTALE